MGGLATKQWGTSQPWPADLIHHSTEDTHGQGATFASLSVTDAANFKASLERYWRITNVSIAFYMPSGLSCVSQPRLCIGHVKRMILRAVVRW
jgi:hypothetical protein